MTLSIESLAVGYGKRPVVKDVTLTIEKGELVGLLGSNGSGKSTLIKTIAGINRPSGGSIRWNGDTVNGGVKTGHGAEQKSATAAPA